MLTVADIREAIKNLPDDALINLIWVNGPPGDDEPGVAIHDFEEGQDRRGDPVLLIHVDLEYLDDMDED